MSPFSPRHRALILVLAVLVVAVLVPAASALQPGQVQRALESPSPADTLLSYSFTGYDASLVPVNGSERLSLSLDEAGYLMMDQAGQPRLPALHESLLIPDGARMGVEVLRAEWYEVPGVDLLPWRGPIPRTVDPASVPYVDGPVYQADAPFPAEVATLGTPYVLHDVRGAVLTVVPFQYNPVTHVLRVYTRIDVRVDAVGPGAVNVIDRASYGQRPDPGFHGLYERQFANYGAYATEPPMGHGDLLIISHGPFMSAMQPLVNWKNAKGIPTTIVDVASIGNTPTAIKNYVTNVYNSSNLAYVLLVGDAAQIASPSYAGGLSDPSYSVITADWYPDLFVGRFSAETVAQVDTQVQRTIEYENQVHDLSLGGWNACGVGIASSQGSGIGHYGEADYDHQGKIRTELMDFGFGLVDTIYEPSATKAMITNALNEGRRVVNYIGHGSSTSWGTTGFNNSDVNNLANVGKLPIIQSVACVNGQFNAGTCFAEAWLRATSGGQPAGAAATYMSTIDQYWAEPMYAQGNHGLGGMYASNERFCYLSTESLGALWFGGSCVMMDITGNAGRDMFMTWTIFGDPSLCVHSALDGGTLLADGWALPVNTPTTVGLTIDAGPDFAGAKYVLLAGASGFSPGLTLPNGLHIPLNFDVFTSAGLTYPDGWLFNGFMGFLDGNGQAQPSVDTSLFTPLDPRIIGDGLYFTALVWHPGAGFELATNVRVLTFTD